MIITVVAVIIIALYLTSKSEHIAIYKSTKLY